MGAMEVPNRPIRYQTYLLRAWPERNGDVSEPIYRFSLEDPHTHQRHGFATVADLLAFIETLFGALVEHQPEANELGENGRQR
jgi:hypothetical protein